ncbi:hypothetical protein [Cupriavidus sp. UYPR2.512]|uniref:hypothetical protein n=1 Tax=Cupriavidus sp. UYPR2.512 TaxID=1080187 RepID=UPI000361C146|nr:hypothetical protein [Cupriavidus sp. UYPR2.512]UIF89451.1 hypothetical protein KAF44_29730 [Cupriavidus necator]
MNSGHNSPDAGAELASFSQFSASATINPLANHGRTAEVFYCGRSICFVDALGTPGLRQAHRGAVNNALYCNEEDGLPDEWLRPLPSKDALADYSEMETRFPRAYARVMNPQQSLL